MNAKPLIYALCILALGTVVSSCGDTQSAPDVNPAETASQTAQETETEKLPTRLEGLEVIDYNGYEFKCYLNNGDTRQVDIMTEETETGDTMNDIIYRRNRAVEEQYNVKITGEDSSDILAMIKKCVVAGDHPYDLYFTSSHAAALAPSGYLYELSTMQNLDLSNPWWDTAALKGMSIYGKVYLITGDISPTSLLTSSCLVFNKNLFSSQDIEYPYQLAAEGKWTIDCLLDITKGLTTDVNGDGKYTYGDDLFGFSSWMCDSPYSLFFGCGGAFSRKTADDVPEVYFDVDRISDIYAKMYDIIVTNQSYFVTDASKYETTYQNFAAGNVYVCEITLQKIDLFLRNMEDDYGILPIPKYNEAQETYLSCVNAAGGFVMVPANDENPARTGMLIEALAAGAYDGVTPSLYEVITKTKNVRDAESADMVELIIKQRVYDPYYMNLLVNYEMIQSQLSSKKAEVASMIAKRESACVKAMDKLVASYAEMNN